MLEVGCEFKKDGLNYTVIDIFDYKNEKYVLFGIEGKKLNYVFYKIENFDGNNYSFVEVRDLDLKNKFLSKYDL
jgi:hypothetical protein